MEYELGTKLDQINYKLDIILELIGERKKEHEQEEDTNEITIKGKQPNK